MKENIRNGLFFLNVPFLTEIFFNEFLDKNKAKSAIKCLSKEKYSF